MLKPHMPGKALQCWKMSKNAGEMHPKSQGAKHRPIRVHSSGSHGSKGPQLKKLFCMRGPDHFLRMRAWR